MPASDRLLLALSDCNVVVNQTTGRDLNALEITFLGESQAKAFAEAFKAFQVEQVAIEDIQGYEAASRAAHLAQVRYGQCRSKLPVTVRRILDERLANERDPA